MSGFRRQWRIMDYIDYRSKRTAIKYGSLFNHLSSRFDFTAELLIRALIVIVIDH